MTERRFQRSRRAGEWELRAQLETLEPRWLLSIATPVPAARATARWRAISISSASVPTTAPSSPHCRGAGRRDPQRAGGGVERRAIARFRTAARSTRTTSSSSRRTGQRRVRHAIGRRRGRRPAARECRLPHQCQRHVRVCDHPHRRCPARLRLSVDLAAFTDTSGDPLVDGNNGYRTFLLQLPAVNANQPLQVTGVTEFNGSTMIDNNVVDQPDTIQVHFNKPLYAGAGGTAPSAHRQPRPRFHGGPLDPRVQPDDRLDLPDPERGAEHRHGLCGPGRRPEFGLVLRERRPGRWRAGVSAGATFTTRSRSTRRRSSIPTLRSG